MGGLLLGVSSVSLKVEDLLFGFTDLKAKGS